MSLTRNSIISIIREKESYALTAFKNSIPEIRGDLDFMFPMKDVKNSNILLIANVNEVFIEVMMDLINKQIIDFTPCDMLVIAADGGEVYDLPLVKTNRKRYANLRWLPLLIKKGINFPK